MNERYDAKAYWDSRQPAYPYRLRQPQGHGNHPRPESLSAERFGAFLRVPVSDRVLWGFTEAAHRDNFLADFGGEAL